MNKALTSLSAIVLACMVCYADIPTVEEFNSANAVVTDILAPKVAEMKAGKAKPDDVADYAVSLIGDSETAAAKYLLAGQAYVYYMKGENYAKAAESIGMMRSAIPDIPDGKLLKALSPAAKGVTAKKAPEVHAILSELQGKVQSEGEIAKLNAQLKNAKASERYAIYRKIGEGYAVLGNWEGALEYFAKGGDEVSKLAQREMDGKDGVSKIAGGWWDASEKKDLKEAISSAYRKHAVELYKKGIDDGSITGLAKKLAEQRIEAGACSAEDSSVKSPFKLGVAPGTVCTLALSDNCNMDFVYCPAGSFKMGYEGAEKIAPLRQIQISRPFWMSRCRVTKRQLRSVGVNDKDSDTIADVWTPDLTIDVISTVMTAKFGNLLPKGYVFRVCTEAEYEYVSKAKTSSGDPRLKWGYSKNGVDSPWGVKDIFRYAGETKLCFADCVPEANGKLCVRQDDFSTRITSLDYSKQPRRDPIMLSKTSRPVHLRRQFGTEMEKEKWKLSAKPHGKDVGSLCGSEFYLVAAPSVDMLNKFP